MIHFSQFFQMKYIYSNVLKTLKLVCKLAFMTFILNFKEYISKKTI